VIIFSTKILRTDNWIANDQLQLLLRNALQILPIVKAQFSGTDFDNLQDVSSCTSPSNADESLACKWKDASRKIQTFQETPEEIKPALNALFEVSLSLI
jgi:hypothetical protein